MLLLAHGFHEVLVNELPDAPPLITVLHQKQVVTVSNQVANIGVWSLAIKSTLFIQKLLDHLGI